MKPSRNFILVFPQFHPPILKNSRFILSAVDRDGDPNPAEQLAGINPTRVTHPAGENRQTHHDRLTGKPSERGRVEMESGGRRGGVRRRIAGNGGKRKKRGLRREVLDRDLTEARRRRWVNGGAGVSGGLREVESE